MTHWLYMSPTAWLSKINEQTRKETQDTLPPYLTALEQSHRGLTSRSEPSKYELYLICDWKTQKLESERQRVKKLTHLQQL